MIYQEAQGESPRESLNEPGETTCIIWNRIGGRSCIYRSLQSDAAQRLALNRSGLRGLEGCAAASRSIQQIAVKALTVPAVRH